MALFKTVAVLSLALTLFFGSRAFAQQGVLHYDYFDDAGHLAGGRTTIPARSPSLSLDSVVKGNVTNLIENGSPKNRVNFVFLGDGYVKTELPKYAQDVTHLVQGIFAAAPFADYASYFNAYRVDIESKVSGVSNENGKNQPKKTPLGMNYWCTGIERLLCVDTAKAAKYAALAPSVTETFTLANSSHYGGSGYPHLSTLAAEDSQSTELALHEIGHSFANLADEYDYGATSTQYNGPEEAFPNLSKENSQTLTSQSLKWFQWLSDPTVGAFEGAGYYQKGLYHPTVDSRMRDLFNAYGAVNVEQFVLNIYKHVKLIESTSPTQISIGNQKLTLKTMMPIQNTLLFQWTVNGAVVPLNMGATATLDTSKLGLTSGKYSITAKVKDITPLVRDENLRESLMTDSRSWTLNIP